MRTRDLSTMWPSTAASLLRGKALRTIAHNTVLLRHDDGFDVTLHFTTILRVRDNGGASCTFTLNTGGWQTVTTKQRLNALLPLSVRLCQRDHQWYVWNRDDDTMLPYHDGMQLTFTYDDERLLAHNPGA